MRIAVGSDHAGFELKQHVESDAARGRPRGRRRRHRLRGVGRLPAVRRARRARLVADGEAERGVLACGSGVGVAIVANKVDGVRAVNAHDADEAEMARRHNDVNVLTLSGARLAPDAADAIVGASSTPSSRAAATRVASSASAQLESRLETPSSSTAAP